MRRFWATEVNITLLLLMLVYAGFLRLTTPAPPIQPWLHAVFGLAIGLYGLTVGWCRQRQRVAAHPLDWLFVLLPVVLFGLVWTSGIVAVTQWLSWRDTVQNGTEASLFYGTSGTQFFHYADTQLCWVLVLPVVGVNGLIHLLHRRRSG